MSMLRQVNPITKRISFQKIPKVLDLPYLIDLQRSSYESFLREGIKETFRISLLSKISRATWCSNSWSTTWSPRARPSSPW